MIQVTRVEYVIQKTDSYVNEPETRYLLELEVECSHREFLENVARTVNSELALLPDFERGLPTQSEQASTQTESKES